MLNHIRRLSAVVIFSSLFSISQAQPGTGIPPAKENKPYKILTSGKQVIIKSTRNIKQVMLWTTGGNRLVEQRAINSTSFTLHIPVNQKTFFLMIGLSDGKIYTEKIGLQ